MDLATILADAQIAISIAKTLIELEQDAAPFVEIAWDVIVKKQPLTAEQRAVMLAKEAELRAQLQQPVPPDDEAAS